MLWVIAVLLCLILTTMVFSAEATIGILSIGLVIILVGGGFIIVFFIVAFIVWKIETITHSWSEAILQFLVGIFMMTPLVYCYLNRKK